jgi:hypothetical protein
MMTLIGEIVVGRGHSTIFAQVLSKPDALFLHGSCFVKEYTP